MEGFAAFAVFQVGLGKVVKKAVFGCQITGMVACFCGMFVPK